jgi:hypothetical protein
MQPVKLDELRNFEFVEAEAVSGNSQGIAGECNMRMRILEVCRQSGFSPHYSFATVDSNQATTIAEGDAKVLVLPESAARIIGPPGVSGLARVMLDNNEAYFEVGIIYLEDRFDKSMSIAVDAFRKVTSKW